MDSAVNVSFGQIHNPEISRIQAERFLVFGQL